MIHCCCDAVGSLSVQSGATLLRDQRVTDEKRAYPLSVLCPTLRRNAFEQRRNAMGKIKVHEFTTLDGVIGAPTWTFDHEFTDDLAQSIGTVTGDARAILLGRTTWVEMAPAWSTRTDTDDPGATFFNETPKHVVSSTLTSVDEWNNSTVLGGYDAERIRQFKENVDGSIYVSGSGTLVRGMLADGLVDELHLYVYPVAVGSGPRLVADGDPQIALRLTECESFSNGVAHLSYAPTL
jgi:dihydrofolate reductase